MKYLQTQRKLWILTALLAFVASVWGVADQGIYEGLVETKYLPGTLGQDLITIAASLALGWLAITARPERVRRTVVAFGILGYLFYAYGIYVMEQVYTPPYLAYMAVFALSFWALAFGAGILRGVEARVPARTKKTSIAVALLQPLVFYPAWIASLIPLMADGRKLENIYSVYILDLCFIMPAFLLTAVAAWRGKPSGILGMPAVFVLGFTLIFSLAVSESVKPVFDQSVSVTGLIMSLALSSLFIVAAMLHLRNMKVRQR